MLKPLPLSPNWRKDRPMPDNDRLRAFITIKECENGYIVDDLWGHKNYIEEMPEDVGKRVAEILRAASLSKPNWTDLNERGG